MCNNAKIISKRQRGREKARRSSWRNKRERKKGGQRIEKDYKAQKTNELIERIRKSKQQKPEADRDEQERQQTRKQIASICARHANSEEDGIDHSGDYFHRIPDEILLHIFSMLDYRDLFVLSLVNSRWLRILNDEEIWKYVNPEIISHLFNLFK